MTSPRVWLITGCSSGIGRRMTEFALEKGDKVVATLRKPADLQQLQSQYTAAQLLVVKLDVTQPEQVLNAFSEAKQAFGRVDIVLNNAGSGVVGGIEATSDESAHRLFEVNFWGMVHVAKEAVRFFREENEKGAGGRLLSVSSETALNPATALGFYSASKFALEAINHVLAKEIDPAWNIQITILELGFIRTQLKDKSEIMPPHPAYSSPSNAVNQAALFIKNAFDSEDATGTLDLEKVVSRMYDATLLATPPVHLPLGRDGIKRARAYMKSMEEDITAYESWSEGLDL